MNLDYLSKVAQRLHAMTIGSTFASARDQLIAALTEHPQLTGTHPALIGLKDEIVELREFFPKPGKPPFEPDYPTLIRRSSVLATALSEIKAPELLAPKQSVYAAVALLVCKPEQPHAKNAERLAGALNASTFGTFWAQTRNELTTAQRKNEGLVNTHPELTALMSQIVALRGEFPKSGNKALQFDLLVKQAYAIAVKLSQLKAKELASTKQWAYAGVMLLACRASTPEPKPAPAPPKAADPGASCTNLSGPDSDWVLSALGDGPGKSRDALSAQDTGDLTEAAGQAGGAVESDEFTFMDEEPPKKK